MGPLHVSSSGFLGGGQAFLEVHLGLHLVVFLVLVPVPVLVPALVPDVSDVPDELVVEVFFVDFITTCEGNVFCLAQFANKVFSEEDKESFSNNSETHVGCTESLFANQ